MIINIILLVLIFVFSILLIANLCGADLPCWDGRGEEEFVKVEFTKKIFYYIVKLI